MKKLIALACTLSAFGVASTLAHADDVTPTQPSVSNSETSTTTVQKDEAGNKVASTTQWKTMKNCTDADGVTYDRGKKGFDNCVTQMKKTKKKEQMGGVSGMHDDSAALGAPSESSATMPSSDVSH